ncbi:hypothetical protein I8752_11795 [Nostocaceae cyanobacterium CENA369]|uniref:Uncharacterized protein n=2 Tax=Dendronalium TaxID=2840442 RepID=A0A8J7I0E8_9NOST|nr:hypothetical protein [Dendronalium phyllosphericum CENA369]
MASLLLGVTSHSDIHQIPQDHLEMELNTSQLFANLDKISIANLAQANREINEKKALDLVWKLPEVQRKAREIQRLSKGSIRVAAIVDGSPTPNEPYYSVRVFEDQPDHNTTIYWFRVLNPSGKIQVLDILENKYITLEAWKEQLKR